LQRHLHDRMLLILAQATLPVAATHRSILTGHHRSPRGRCRGHQGLSHFQKRPAVTILLMSPIVTDSTGLYFPS